jgi:hypothetical protein
MDVLRMSVDRKVCWVYVTDSVAEMRITKQNSGDGVAREREREKERERERERELEQSDTRNLVGCRSIPIRWRTL